MPKSRRSVDVILMVTVALMIVALLVIKWCWWWSLRIPDPVLSGALDARKTYRSAPLLESPQEQKKAGDTLQRLFENDTVQYRCQNLYLIKNREEGWRYYCRDGQFAVTPPCLVYSFGINYDFTFDDAFADMGCDVFSFDPSMNTSDHRRSPRVMFYQIGLGGADSDTFRPRLDRYVKKKTNWKVRTLKTLVSMLDHTKRTIDVLKVDTECSEWDAVRNMLDTGILRQVKQLLIEWHIMADCPARERFQQLIAELTDLNRAGFKIFHKIPQFFDLSWDSLNILSEFGYVNNRFIRH